jgi:hypothetical protein
MEWAEFLTKNLSAVEANDREIETHAAAIEKLLGGTDSIGELIFSRALIAETVRLSIQGLFIDAFPPPSKNGRPRLPLAEIEGAVARIGASARDFAIRHFDEYRRRALLFALVAFGEELCRDAILDLASSSGKPVPRDLRAWIIMEARERSRAATAVDQPTAAGGANVSHAPAADVEAEARFRASAISALPFWKWAREQSEEVDTWAALGSPSFKRFRALNSELQRHVSAVLGEIDRGERPGRLQYAPALARRTAALASGSARLAGLTDDRLTEIQTSSHADA